MLLLLLFITLYIQVYYLCLCVLMDHVLDCLDLVVKNVAWLLLMPLELYYIRYLSRVRVVVVLYRRLYILWRLFEYLLFFLFLFFRLDLDPLHILLNLVVLKVEHIINILYFLLYLLLLMLDQTISIIIIILFLNLSLALLVLLQYPIIHYLQHLIRCYLLILVFLLLAKRKLFILLYAVNVDG